MTDAAPPNAEIAIRLATEADHSVISQLFRASAVEGQLRVNDTGADIENLRDAYFSDDGASGFWVACDHEEVVGMIGVQRTSKDQAEVRRLRVREDHRRRGLGSRLMQHATRFCREHGYLKVVLDVRVERAPAIAMFRSMGFTLAREKQIEDQETLDFFLNLYQGGDPPR